MTLQTGATLITLSLLLNKISGLYGILALLTGFHLSPVQLSMYIYSLIALVLTAFLAPYIRTQSPLQCLALAWFYLFDTVVNAAYTAAFAATWFLVVSQHHHSAPTSGPGSSTIGDTAGFTNPKYNVSSVDLSNNPQDSVASAQPASAPAGTQEGSSSTSPSFGNGVLQPESIQSIAIVCTIWTIRVYFVFVILAFARQCLRQHAFYSRSPASRYGSAPSGHSRNVSTLSAPDGDPNPFAVGAPEGQGWKGKLGRVMVSVGRSYWIEGDDDFSWMTGMSRKFRKSVDPNGPGLTERERRRRSGTGPPLPSQTTMQAASFQHSRNSSGSGHNMGQSVKMYELSESR